MKKISVVSLISLFFLVISSSVAYAVRDLGWGLGEYFIVGVILLVGSGVIAYFAKERTWLNILCSAISAVAMGFLIRAWYVLRELENNFGTMMLVSFAAVAYIWVFFLVSRIPILRRHSTAYKIFVFLWVLVSGVSYAAVVFTTRTTFVSTFGYYMLIEFAFIFAMSLDVDSPAELVRNITLSTYSIFAVVIIILVMIAIGSQGGDCDCDGDGACDCCEACGNSDCSGGKNEKGKNKKSGFSAP